MLHYDDIAALNRIYPITAGNLAAFPGKQLTAANTVSIQGTVTFSTGLGMQGVNVVARPLDADGNPLYQYTVTFVSGAYFSGNHGNPVTGFTDANGNLLTMWGSNDAALQGYFDLSGIPLPPGMTTANYQVTFEAINPLYILTNSVGPYRRRPGRRPPARLRPSPSPACRRACTQTLTVNVADSAVGGYKDAIGTQAAPRILPASGLWCGRLSQVGQTDWFSFPVRGNRTFTIVTQALDETGAPTESKAMPAIGVWDAFDPVGATAVGAAPASTAWPPAKPGCASAAAGDDIVRIGIADQRGDGRPDYAYNGWVLYADTVSAPAPARLRRPHRHSRHGLSLSRTRCWSAASPPWSPASRPTRSPPSLPPPPPASPARSTSRWTTCPSSTPRPSSPAASVTTPARATRSPCSPRP